MKPNRYLLLIGLFVILLSLLSAYFYQRNAIAMRARAEYFFVRTLTNELGKKMIKLKLPHLSWTSSDTIPLTVCITTAEGTKEYKVDADKSLKNISRSSMERSLHSVVWEESPLSLDTLNRLWADTLRAQRIGAKTTIHVSMTTLRDSIFTSSSGSGNNPVGFSSRFASYIGNRCEVEVIGFLKYPWWEVCLYHWFPFLWILVGATWVLLLSCLFYRLVHRPAKIEIVREEVIREVIKEVPREVIVEKIVEKKVIHEIIKKVSVPFFVQGLDTALLSAYSLCPDLFFDSHRQVLVLNGVDSKLAPQSCVVLKMFLDAPDYTLTDTEILKCIWGENEKKTIKDFTAAYYRLSKVLNDMGCTVRFNRVGYDQYRMIID